MTNPLINLVVTTPSVYTPVRTQSYKVDITASVVRNAVEGRFGFLDNRFFVVQDNEDGSTDFLRIVEPRDFSLPVEGPLRRVSNLSLYVSAKQVYEEMISEIVSDIESLVRAHLDDATSVVHVSSSEPVVSVSAGDRHSAAIDASGRVWCWGLNTEGQASVPPSALQGAVSVACGGTVGKGFTLALLSDGLVIHWGVSKFHATLPEVPVPEEIGQDPYGKAVKIACGSSHMVALTENGYVVSWGSNRDHRVLGGPYNQTLTKFIHYEPDVVDISCGWESTALLLEDGRIRTWGANMQGQRPGEVIAPNESLTTEGGYIQVSAGFQRLAAIKPDKTVAVWGAGASGAYAPPEGLMEVKRVGASHGQVVALTESNELTVWGESWSNVVLMANNSPDYFELPSSPGVHPVGFFVAPVGFHAVVLYSNGRVANLGRGSSRFTDQEHEGQGRVPPSIAF